MTARCLIKDILKYLILELMKSSLILLSLFLMGIIIKQTNELEKVMGSKSIYDISINSLMGEKIDFTDFKGKF